MAGVAAWRESSTQGGERKAAEVTAHTPIAASSTTALAPTKGRAMKAAQETAVTPSIQGPTRARPARTRSSQNPVSMSVSANTSWSATRIQGTQCFGIPACAASCGRYTTYRVQVVTNKNCVTPIQPASANPFPLARA
jgi:hypothetical protein